jgi:hypothetical protein
LSVEQNDSRESISLGRTLLESLGLSLSSVTDDVVKLKDWENDNFPIENVHNVTDILLQLSRKGIINASHLGKLRDFFESILRIEFVHIIDEFLVGNYSVLRQIPTSKFFTAVLRDTRLHHAKTIIEYQKRQQLNKARQMDHDSRILLYVR